MHDRFDTQWSYQISLAFFWLNLLLGVILQLPAHELSSGLSIWLAEERQRNNSPDNSIPVTYKIAHTLISMFVIDYFFFMMFNNAFAIASPISR